MDRLSAFGGAAPCSPPIHFANPPLPGIPSFCTRDPLGPGASYSASQQESPALSHATRRPTTLPARPQPPRRPAACSPSCQPATPSLGTQPRCAIGFKTENRRDQRLARGAGEARVRLLAAKGAGLGGGGAKTGAGPRPRPGAGPESLGRRASQSSRRGATVRSRGHPRGGGPCSAPALQKALKGNHPPRSRAAGRAPEATSDWGGWLDGGGGGGGAERAEASFPRKLNFSQVSCASAGARRIGGDLLPRGWSFGFRRETRW